MAHTKLDSQHLLACQALFDQLWTEESSKSPVEVVATAATTAAASQVMQCPVCHEDSVKRDCNLIVCVNCGIEIDDQVCSEISDRPEWKFDEEKNNDRCGPPTNELLYESSYSTSIAPSHFASSHQRKMLNKLQLWQAMPSKERTLRDDFNEITIACGDNEPKCVVQYAKVLFKMVEEARRMDSEGHRKEIRVALLASAVFYACKIHGRVRSYKEISNWFNIQESSFTQGLKIFFRLMCNKISMTELVTNHRDYVDKFCNNLGLSKEVREMSHDIANKSVTLGILRGNTPATIAASSIFFVINMYGLNISKKLVSKQTGISEVTIGKTYQKLNSYLEHLL
jgi:transcription initiation factor TFIIB